MLKTKKTLLVLVALFVSVKAHAQTPIVQRLEVEIRGGLSTPLGQYDSRIAPISVTYGLEVRYNFEGSPWDCGLMFDKAIGFKRKELPDGGFNYLSISNHFLAFAGCGDYNMRQGKRVNPFVGAALGVVTTGTSMLFAPRIGVEFFRHLRLMAQFNVCGKAHNNLGITIGLVVGGRPKKR